MVGAIKNPNVDDNERRGTGSRVLDADLFVAEPPGRGRGRGANGLGSTPWSSASAAPNERSTSALSMFEFPGGTRVPYGRCEGSISLVCVSGYSVGVSGS